MLLFSFRDKIALIYFSGLGSTLLYVSHDRKTAANISCIFYMRLVYFVHLREIVNLILLNAAGRPGAGV